MPKFSWPLRLLIDILSYVLVVVADYGTLYLLYITPLGDILRIYSLLVCSGAGLLVGLAYAFLIRNRLLYYPNQEDISEKETAIQQDHQQANLRLTVPLHHNEPKLTVPLYREHQ